MDYFSDFASRGPRVQHPPEVVSGSQFNHSPVDWAHVCSELKIRHSRVGSVPLQKHVDELWHFFQSEALRELVACHTIRDGQDGMPSTGNTKLGRLQSLKPKKVSEPTPAEDHCLHRLLEILIDLTQGIRVDTFEVEGLVSPVAELLEILPSAVQDWMHAPWDGVDKL
eukprot:4250211-Amphidinium_carterae.1